MEIAPTLLKVFVSIEMTGESVDEYMIYNYRRPMYKILKHLWKLPDHNARLVQLAATAYETIENAGQFSLAFNFVSVRRCDLFGVDKSVL